MIPGKIYHVKVLTVVHIYVLHCIHKEVQKIFTQRYKCLLSLQPVKGGDFHILLLRFAE